MSKAFFLTRQTANLMEDFLRELGSAPSLFLLYGDAGVGKTRTLEELVRTRLGDARVHWIDLQAGGTGDGALVDSSGMIGSVFTEAQAGDIVIADHFEMALKKTRHQLFLSWSTDGIDRQMNLIIASNSDYFNELRQLAQQYQARVQSFQQMPFSPDEAAAFLGFYLFPDRPIGNLSIPPVLRNQLAAAQGNVARIIEVAEPAGEQITTAPMDDTESIRQGSRIIVGVLVTVALVIGIGWYLLSSQRGEDEARVADSASRLPAQTGAAPTAESATGERLEAATAVDAGAGAEPTRAQPVDDVDDAAPPADAAVGATATLEQEPAPAAAEPEAPVEPEAATEMQTEPESTAEPEAVPEVQTEPESTAAAAVADTALPATPQGQLQNDLQASLDWIRRTGSQVGTLQIMLLNLARFDEDAYYDYIELLEQRGIDTSAIRIFRTMIGGQEVYSVVYGEFDSRAAAGKAKSDLPQVLRKNSPIPRSVGGLMEEIRRLDAEN